MPKKNIQLNTANGFRETEASSFVIDLRAKTGKKAASNSEKSESARDIPAAIFTAGQEIFNESAKLLNPNLLNFNRPRKRRGARFFKKIFNSWRQLEWSLPTFRLHRRRRLWDQIFENQAKAFRKATRLKKGTFWSFGNYSGRQAAEEKVVWYRSILSFVIVLILIIVPLKVLSYFELFNLERLEKNILSRSHSALTNLLAATEAISQFDLAAADSGFLRAGSDFLAAQEELSQINDSILSLAALSSDPKFKLAAEGKKFLRVGAASASLGRNLVLATDSLFNHQAASFSLALENFSFYGTQAVKDARTLEKELEKVKVANLPPEYQTQFVALTKQVGMITESLNTFISVSNKFKDFLGATQDKRYLLVFQNNAELRASGGFLGSYALVDIRDGKIRNLEVPGGGSYDTEGGMNVRVVAPKPLWLVNPLWHFWDANWWPDWPTTAKNLMWFYEKSDGPTVDGVISVTPTVVERLLAITGPIDLTKEYGLVITADNFWETVQKVVEHKNLVQTNPEALAGIPATSLVVESSLAIKQELEVNSDNKPKKIIGDLLAKILEILPQKLNQENLIKILALLEGSLSEKQVLAYFTDNNLQAEVAKYNFAGEIKDSPFDYLMVVNTNIAGQKSDRKMVEKIEHVSQLEISGSITNTLTITREHTGVKNEPLTGVRNVDWLRVYVPLGSELLSAIGFQAPDAKYFNELPQANWEENELVAKENRALSDELSGTKVYEENGKTVFANWVMVDPGESAVIVIKYRLPFNFLNSQVVETDFLSRLNRLLNPDQNPLQPYSLLVQKQPGAKPSTFSSELLLPSNLEVFWHSEEDSFSLSGWKIATKIDRDKYWSVLIEKNN